MVSIKEGMEQEPEVELHLLAGVASIERGLVGVGAHFVDSEIN
jgi:hypothetical protein